jgi:iron complex transport system substrate-binding protein
MNGQKMIRKVLFSLLATLFLVGHWAPDSTASPQSALQYARSFRIASLSGCKLVTIDVPWRKGISPHRYLLVPRGQSEPAEHPPAQVIFVPVRRVVALSTTHLAYIDAAGKTDTLVGLANFKMVNTASARRRIDAGRLKEVGHATSLRIETLLDLSPDLILSTASGSIYDVHPKLAEAGLPAVLIIDYLERHPLGRLEWIKFMALLLGTEDHARGLFYDICQKYQRLAAQTAGLNQRPKIISGTPFRGQWWIDKADSFMAQFIRDAGGIHLWPEISGTGSHPMDIETVYARALDSDIWLNPGTWRRTADARAADPRFADVRALKTGKVFNNNKRLNQWGGNDYWESGMLNPDVVLADLIAILHPKLLPNHELVYYRSLDP